MYRSSNVFSVLAERVAVGDGGAPTELCRQLEPAVVHMVRRVIQKGAARSAVDRRILVEAERVGLDADSAAGADGEYLIRTVARCVSSLFVDSLRPRQGSRFGVEETVCT